MEITTNVLLNYLRCRRYAALNYPNIDYLSREKFFENHDRYHQSLKDILLAVLKQNHEHIAINEDVSYDFHPEIKLVENFDFIVDNDGEKIIYTILPVTSRTFMKLTFKQGKHRYKLLRKNADGIYEIRQEKLDSNDEKYYQERVSKLLSRHHDIGRHAYEYAYRCYLYQKAYPNQQFKHYIVLLNPDYVYDGISYHKSLFHFIDLSALLEEYNEIIEVDLYRIINHIELNDFTPCRLVKNECLLNDSFECKFTDFCFAHVPKENSILDYFQSHLGFTETTEDHEIHHSTYALLNDGKVDMLDVPISWLKNDKHLMQRYCVEANYTHINKAKIKAILKTLRYPLIYLDFEAFPCLLPRFKGEHPYTQSVFQYSVHIEHVENKLDQFGKDHFEFLADPDIDERERLLTSLLDILDRYDSSIIVYNKNFEEQRLLEFKEIFPKYAEAIDKVIDRLFDLLDVVRNDTKFFIEQGFSEEDANQYNFYHPKMSGSYSLKRVVAVFDETAYDKLDINNGKQAFKAYLKLKELPESLRGETLNNLKRYCNQDTYSMYLIIQGLKKLIGPKFKIK